MTETSLQKVQTTRVSLLFDSIKPEGREWWVEVALSDTPPNHAVAMFYLHDLPDRAAAERQLREIGRALLSSPIEDGMVSCPERRTHGQSPKADVPPGLDKWEEA